ncbi:hypothetical protein HDU92_008994 [Lobulomyces angularis]|nr:hypothetical protein HDU92_008994 [Lobulomyces angularis]
MSFRKQIQTLKYSDKINIELEDVGNLFSDSFETEQNVVISTNSPSHPKVDMSKSIFKILPRQEYKEQKKLRELTKGNFVYNFWENLQQKYQVDFIKCEVAQIVPIKEQMNYVKTEMLGNQKEIIRMEGKPIHYGEVINFQHEYTKKFLGSFNSHTGKEADSMLTWNVGENCLFIILPRYKVRNDGEPIYVGDKVIIKNIKTGYLRVGDVTEDAKLGGALFEELHDAVNNFSYIETFFSSASITEWRLNLYSQFEKEKQGIEKIKTGELIRFYNLESESYLACSSDASTIGLKKHIFHPAKPFQCDDSAVFWQIISVNEKSSKLTFGQFIRLRNGLTGQYLCGTNSEALSLTPSPDKKLKKNDPTLFAIIPAHAASDIVDSKCKLRIQHLLTKRFLHIKTEGFQTNSNKFLTGGEFIESYDSLEMICEDGVSLIESLRDSDMSNVFTISIVKSEVADNFNYVCSFQTPLKNAIKSLGYNEGGNFVLNSVKDILCVLSIVNAVILFCIQSEELDPLKRRGAPITSHQQLIKSTGTLNLIATLLKVPFSQVKEIKKNKQAYSSLVVLLRHVYHLLNSFITGNIEVNGPLIYKNYFPYILSHAGIGVGCGNLITELVNCRSVVENFTDQDISSLIQLVCSDRDRTDLIEIIISLSYANGKPIPRIQKIILEEFLLKNSYYFKKENKSGTLQILLPNHSYMELAQFVSEYQNQKEFFIFEASLRLFECLCAGKQAASIDFLVKHGFISTTECKFMLLDDRVPATIKTNYVNLLIAAFIDILDEICKPEYMVVFYNAICPEFPAKHNKIYPDLSTSTKTVLHSLSPERNTAQFKEFSYLFQWIMETLTSTQKNESYQTLIKSCLKLLKILIHGGFLEESYFDQILVVVLHHINNQKQIDSVLEMGDTNFGKSQLIIEEEFSSVVACEIIDLIMTLRLYKRVNKTLSAWKGSSSLVTPTSILKLIGQIDYGVLENLQHILLPLTSSTNVVLRMHAFRLLRRNYLNYMELEKYCRKTLILTSSASLEAFKKLSIAVTRFKNLSKNPVSNSNMEELVSLLIDLGNSCRIKVCEVEIPNVTNQNILSNFNFHEILFEFVNKLQSDSKKSHIKVADDSSGKCEVYFQCSQFLRLYSALNDEITDILWGKLDILLFLAEEPRCVELIISLISTPTMCTNLSLNNIQKILQNFFYSPHVSYIKLLKKITYNEGISFRDHQTAIIKFLTKLNINSEFSIWLASDDFESLIPTSSKFVRSNYFSKMNEKFFNLLDLISTCCTGLNEEAINFTRKLIKPDDLLALLSNSFLTLSHTQCCVNILRLIFLEANDLKKRDWMNDLKPIFGTLRTCFNSQSYSPAHFDIMMNGIIPFVKTLSQTSELLNPEFVDLLLQILSYIDQISTTIDNQAFCICVESMEYIALKFPDAFSSEAKSCLTRIKRNADIQLSQQELIKYIDENESKQNASFQNFLDKNKELLSSSSQVEFSSLIELFYSYKKGMEMAPQKKKILKMLVVHLNESVDLHCKPLDTGFDDFKILIFLIEAVISRQKSDNGDLELTTLQRELCNLGAADLAMKYACSQHFDYQILGFRLMLCLLHGGNQYLQNAAGHLLQQMNLTTVKIADDEEEEKKNKFDVKYAENDFLSMTVVLRVIQLLCEEFYMEAKNYFRYQPDNLKNFNIVAKVVQYFEALVRLQQLQSTAYQNVVKQSLETITELIQGCTHNQLDLFHAKATQSIFTLFSNILKYRETSRKSVVHNETLKEPELDLLESATESLLAIVEGTFFEHAVYKEIVETSDWNLIFEIINLYSTSDKLSEQLHIEYSTLVKKEKASVLIINKLENSENIVKCALNCYKYYILLKKYFPISLMKTHEDDVGVRLIQNESIGCVEVLISHEGKDNLLALSYFELPPECQALTEHDKSELVDSVDRSTPQIKLEDFHNRCDQLIYQMTFKYNQKKNHPLIYKFFAQLSKRYHLIWIFAYAISLIQNFLNGVYLPVFGARITDNFGDISIVTNDTILSENAIAISFGNNSVDGYIQTCKILGIIKIFLWTVILIEFIYRSIPVKSYQSKGRKQFQWLGEEFRNSNVKNNELYISPIRWLSEDLVPAFQLLMQLLISPDIWYHLFMLTMATLSFVFFQTHYLSAIFEAILLIDAAYRIEIITTIFVAFTARSLQLSSMLWMLIVITAIYSVSASYVIAYNFPTNSCTVLTLGVTNNFQSGMDGDVNPDFVNSSQTTLWGWGLILVSFYIVINTFFLNAVTGLVVDSFGDQRGKREANLEEMKSFCMERKDFQHQSGGFDEHIKKDHYMWNYLKFLLYLNLRSTTDHSNIENIIFKKLTEEDFSWMPVGRAMSLETSRFNLDFEESNLSEEKKEQIINTEDDEPVVPASAKDVLALEHYLVKLETKISSILDEIKKKELEKEIEKSAVLNSKLEFGWADEKEREERKLSKKSKNTGFRKSKEGGNQESYGNIFEQQESSRILSSSNLITRQSETEPSTEEMVTESDPLNSNEDQQFSSTEKNMD